MRKNIIIQNLLLENVLEICIHIFVDKMYIIVLVLRKHFENQKFDFSTKICEI